VESVDENGKPQLYLVFEYLDSDLKKYIDSHGRGNSNPIPAKTIQVKRFH
jgi:cyclin-dependent kinase